MLKLKRTTWDVKETTMQQAQSPARLTPAESRYLRRVLARRFELEQVKDLAFDLGAEYTVFHQESRRAFCRELVACHDRRGRANCLAAAIRDRVREEKDALDRLLARLPACTPWVRLQIALEEGQEGSLGTLLGALAERRGVSPAEIVLVTAVRGSVRLLVSAPARMADDAAPASAAGDAVTLFEALDAIERHAWRWVAETWPPMVAGGVLQPVASWEEALDAVRANLTREGFQSIEDGQSSGRGGEHGRAIESLERAVDIARELGDKEMEAAALGHLGNARYAQGQVEQAIERYRQALTVAREISRESGDRRTEGIHLGNLGVAYYAQGQAQAAIAYYQRALTIARKAGDLRTEGNLLGNLGLAYSALTQTTQSTAAAHSTAVDYYQQALAIVREVDDRRAEGTLLGHLGDAYRGMGQAPGAGGAALRRANLYTAADTYHRALVIVREIGDRRSEGDLLGRLGNTYLSLGELGDGQYRAAIDHYQQAVAIARAVGDRLAEGARLGNLASTLYALGQISQARDTYRQALAIARAVGDRRGEGTRLGNLGNVYYALAVAQGEGAACGLSDAPEGSTSEPGDWPASNEDNLGAAVDVYRQALDIAREVGDRRAEGIHLSHLGLVYSALGERVRPSPAPGDAPLADAFPPEDAAGVTAPDEQVLAEEAPQPADLPLPEGYFRAAIEAHKQALDIAREIGDRKAEGINLGCLGDVYSAMGQVPGDRPRDQRPAAARECYRQALAIAREIGDRRAEAHHLGSLGSVYGALGEQEQAIASLEQALIVVREIGDRQAEAAHLGSLGEAYSSFRQDGRARTYFQQAVSVAHDLGDRRCEGNWLGDLGDTYSATGQYEQAVRCYSHALDIARETGDRRNEATWLGNLGNAYVALREVQRGIEIYEEALAIARSTGGRQDQVGLLGNLGNAYSVQRQWDEASAAYKEAIQVACEAGDRRGEGIWLLNLGLALFEQGDREGAVAQVTAARNALEAAGSPEAAQAMETLEEWAEEK
jgi:tetratricopeptide (TPR) repeat protein